MVSDTEIQAKEENKINVEVVYAYPDKYFLKKLQVPQNTTIQNIILLSGVLEKYTEIDLRENKVGIFSRLAKLNETVENGDRIEIYRPLLADPKEIRRKKAAEQAAAKK
ncbi:RnfH family protein [Mannheimia granulomatis]|uniref:RnfH family protein n=1 Tax=Mannheimia granulomatis TaxID=85402 RepID=UPI00067BEAC8|nr:RnfH family protein [Mannheimia granulomatis]QLB18631.1 RnfH family protein [Mannheimia granulomatis]